MTLALKRLLSILLFILFINNVFANRIDEATAKLVAVHFLQGRSTKLNYISPQNLIPVISSKDSTGTYSQPCYYLFNLTASKGFIIVSATDNVQPILGYSFESSFDTADVPIQLAEWLQKRKQEIAYAIKNNFPVSDEIKTHWQELINPSKKVKYQLFGNASSVSPMLHTTWNQSPYYNAQCPKGTLTGCVATAMAQILKYWNYPAKGTGYHSYTPPDTTLGVQSVKFSSSSYQWSLMPASVSAATPTNQLNAVAKLMYDCGVSVNMQYGFSESAAYMVGGGFDISYALKTFFGYNDSLKSVDKDKYSDPDWLNIIKTELNTGRPILWAGFGADISGHCFIADGYDANNYIHFNWGWGGQANGYFSITALNPYPYPGGFNINEHLIIGVKPTYAAYNLSLSSPITTFSQTVNYGKPIVIKTNVINTGDSIFKGDLCAAIFDTSSNFTNYIQRFNTKTILAGDSINSGIIFSNKDSAIVAPGTYTLYIYYRIPGGRWQNLISNGNFFNYIKITVLDSSAKPPTTVYTTSKQKVCTSQLPFFWKDNWYTQSGTYTYTSNVQNDTITVSTLVLTVNNATVGTKNVNICSGKLPYTWNGVSYTTSGTYTKMLTNSVGCDSTAILILNIIYPTTSTVSLVGCGSVLYNGKTYLKSKVLSDTLRSAQGCDSVYQLVNITVNKILISSVSIATKTDTIPFRTPVTFTATPVNNGTTTIYQWRRNSNNVNEATVSTYTFDSLNNGDTISCLLITVNTCGSISTNVSNRIIVKVVPQYLLAGNFNNPMGISINNVSVGLNNINTLFSSKYKFIVDPNKVYTVLPHKNNDTYPSNGVSIKDILLIQSYLLGKATLSTPYQLIAADVNNDGQISVLDILYIKRLILGIDSCFPNNRLWAFVDSSYQFPDPSNPFPYKNTITVSNLLADLFNKSFIGIKLGDVNFDWNPNALTNHSIVSKPVGLTYSSNSPLGKSMVKVPIKVTDFRHIAGLQFTINYDYDAFRLQAIEHNILNMDYSTNPAAKGKVAFLWNDAQKAATSLEDSTVLMELVFTKLSDAANPALSITSDIAPIEMVDANLKSVGIRFNQEQMKVPAISESWEVSPNPCDGLIRVNLTANQTKQIQFELVGIDGKILLQQTTTVLSGKNTISLNLNQQTRRQKGIYYLKAVGIDGGEVKKIMIR